MAGGDRKDYKMYIKIAGEIDKSLPESARLSKAELRAIAREASAASATTSANLRKGLQETKPMFDKFSHAAKKALKVTVASATAASVAIGSFSVKTGMAYESQMSTVRALSQASDADMLQLDKTAQHLGLDGERIRASNGIYVDGWVEGETDGGCGPGNDEFGFGIRRGFG